ncbi:MAG: BLUF domain-containing protein [Rubrivivax sp.]|nr:BLUF domain-containing protein [Rubrivivax sp.]
MLYHVIYSSRATPPLTVEQLQEILEDARAGNEKRDVTGALLYIDGVFMQVLEGEKDTVVALMARITADTRHEDVRVYHEGAVDHRVFGSWRMAYADGTPAQLSAWAGLPGTTTLDAILAELGRDTTRASAVARGILGAIAG